MSSPTAWGRAQSSDDHGFALLVVLWSLSLLSILAFHLVANGRQGAQLAANLRTSAELEAAADAGLHHAIFRMLDRSGQNWRADGKWREAPSPHAEVRVLLTSLDGRINPNTAATNLLAALFRQLGVSGPESFQLATRIQEWRVPGRFPRTQQVKTAEYLAAGRNYGPAGAPFQNLEELRDVLGMTPTLFSDVAKHLSIYTQDDPDRNVADPVVVQAMAEAAGLRVYNSPGHGQDHAVSVRVVAVGAEGTQFIRQAVVLVNLRAGDRPWRVVALQDER